MRIVQKRFFGFFILLLFSIGIAKAESVEMDSLSHLVVTSDENHAEALRKLTIYFFTKESYQKALEYAELGIKDAKRINNQPIIGQLTLIKAYIYLNWGLTQKAVLAFADAKRIGETIKDSEITIGGYHGIGRAYIELKMYKEAIREFHQGLKIKDDSLSIEPNPVFYNALGMAYQEYDDLDSAIYYFKIFLKISQQKNDSVNMLYALVNIGEANNLSGNYEQAIGYFDQAGDLNKFLHNTQAKAALLGNIAEVYFNKNEFEKSLDYAHKGMKICRLNHLTKFQMDNYKLVVKDYLSIGDSAHAVLFYDEYISFIDSVNQADKVKTISYLNAQYKIEEGLKEAEILGQKLKNRSVFLYFSVALIVLAILLLVLLYSRYKTKARTHQQEKKELSLTIDEKNRELVGKILSDSQNKNSSDEVIQCVQKAIDADSQEEIRQILVSLKTNLQKGKPKSFNWDDFSIHFQQVHPEFFNSLKNLDKNLSTNELRHCAYIKMNLSTKEIAGFLNVGDRAVQTARYRIKKKLGLQPEIDLAAYIKSL